MIGDKLTYYAQYKEVTHQVIEQIKSDLQNRRVCISIGGESGCGKTSLAYSLQLDIEKELGLRGFLFHMDDYFKLPPKDNHKKREQNIERVGIEEVNLFMLNQNILDFKKGVNILRKPLIDYTENLVSSETIYTNDFDFCIVEGTYVTLLDDVDYKVFMKKNYKETKSNRLNRGRDQMSDFNEHVLAIEHNIIRKHANLAHFVIDNQFKLHSNQP
jgi:uridine kinase